MESSSSAASVGVKSTNTPTQRFSNSVPNDLNRANPYQPVLKSYPRTLFGGRERCFSAAWYQSRPWLEYSVDRDACFCFPCRVFGVAFSENDTFVSTGFRNWKAALERDRGLQKHACSQTHLQASSSWTEFCRRQVSGETVACLLGPQQIEKNRYYIKSMAGVVKFLAVNELPLRGDCETCDSEEDCIAAGLFAKLFKYTLEKDKYLADITSGIPQNAKYTSKTIQNEVIEILASMVLKKIKQKYDTADLAAFCLKSDGTRDRCNTENLSVIIRFVCNGVPEEHLIGLLELLKYYNTCLKQDTVLII